MVRVKDTLTDAIFEVSEDHWAQNLWKVRRYEKAPKPEDLQRKSVGRPKRTHTDKTKD